MGPGARGCGQGAPLCGCGGQAGGNARPARGSSAEPSRWPSPGSGARPVAGAPHQRGGRPARRPLSGTGPGPQVPSSFFAKWCQVSRMSAWGGKTNLDPYFTSKNTTTMEHRPHGDEIREGLKGAGKSPEDQAWALQAGRESISRKRKGGWCFATVKNLSIPRPPWGATGARNPGTSKDASRASASKQPGTRTRPPEWACRPRWQVWGRASPGPRTGPRG